MRSIEIFGDAKRLKYHLVLPAIYSEEVKNKDCIALLFNDSHCFVFAILFSRNII